MTEYICSVKPPTMRRFFHDGKKKPVAAAFLRGMVSLNGTTLIWKDVSAYDVIHFHLPGKPVVITARIRGIFHLEKPSEKLLSLILEEYSEDMGYVAQTKEVLTKELAVCTKKGYQFFVFLKFDELRFHQPPIKIKRHPRINLLKATLEEYRTE